MSTLSLFGTALGLGFAHVLTGPDHLSALATLSANVGNFRAFWLGVRWGVGHSMGLILVGVILISISQSQGDEEVIMPHTLGVVFESLVGVFMLLLGAFGLSRAFKKRGPDWIVEEEVLSVHTLPLQGSSLITSGVDNTTATAGQEKCNDPTTLGENNDNCPPSMNVDEVVPSSLDVVELGGHVPMEQNEAATRSDNGRTVSTEHDENDAPVGCKARIASFWRNLSYQSVALGIGIVHGLAGPGGVLGVIPAVQIKDWKLSTLYLGTFCVTSTVVMGCFAALYGTCSAKLGMENAKWEFRIEVFSASLSIIVGIIWIVLSATGKMEAVFH